MTCQQLYYVPLRENASQPFGVEICIAQLQNTACLVWPQTVTSPVSHPIAPMFRELYPGVCNTNKGFVFSCWKVKAEFKTETASLLSLTS